MPPYLLVAACTFGARRAPLTLTIFLRPCFVIYKLNHSCLCQKGILVVNKLQLRCGCVGVWVWGQWHVSVQIPNIPLLFMLFTWNLFSCWQAETITDLILTKDLIFLLSSSKYHVLTHALMHSCTCSSTSLFLQLNLKSHALMTWVVFIVLSLVRAGSEFQMSQYKLWTIVPFLTNFEVFWNRRQS